MQKKEFLLSLIRDVKKEKVTLKKIPFDDFFELLFRSIEYLSGYSENEIKSGSSVRDLCDLRKMICIICFANRNEYLLARKIMKEISRGETYIYVLRKDHEEENEVYKKISIP